MSATLPAVYSFPPAALAPATSETPDPAGAVASTTVPVPPRLKPAVDGLPSEFCVYGPLTGLHGPNLLMRPGFPGAPEHYRSDGACPACKAWWDRAYPRKAKQ